ncbi:MAG: FtsW/RodA/SpoVE family cell cycle protein [Erysipelotrichaceae bacterium]|nr:FtsW/RodA/SpoVE family cell cycle protein [Erysipelotrichaceae bacterium]
MAQKNKKNKQPLSLIRLRSHSDGMITFLILVLMAFGSLMIVSTNVGQTVYNSNIVFTTTIRQLIIMSIGYGLYVGVSKLFHFRWVSFFQVPAFFGMIGMMILPFFFEESGGSHAWIRLPGGFTIQPAEFLKPFIILVVAIAMYQAKRKTERLKEEKLLFRFPYICMAVFAVLLILQKDLGTLAVLTVTFFTCILVPSEKVLVHAQRRIVGWGLALSLAAVGLFGVTDIGTDILAQTPFSHVATRIKNAKNPYNNIYGEGYQPANSLFGIGSSNIVGKGIGDSTRKYGYLTQADNDYILAVIIEETGIFGFGLIVLLYLLLIGRLFYYAFKTNEVVFKIILAGTSAYFFMHFFLNVGGVACLIPFTGVPLLFISSGGSSLFAACVALGVCQNCIRLIREKEMSL